MKSELLWLIALAMMGTLVTSECGVPHGASPAPTPSPPSPTTLTPSAELSCVPGGTVERRAQEALSRFLGLSMEKLEVLSIEAAEWSDTSLGCPEPGMLYAQVIVPGCRVVMRVDSERYEYHSGGGNGVLCDEAGRRLSL